MLAQDWLPFLGELADRSDEIASRWFQAPDLRVSEKPDKTPVTIADEEIEEAVRALVRQRHPELGVYGEEQGEKPGASEARLIIDPIDGTRNFSRGIPVFATLLAIELAGEVIAGFVSAPSLRTRWAAARGFGAFLGRRPIRVSAISRIEEMTLFHGTLGRNEMRVWPPPGLLTLGYRARRTRGFGDFYQHVLVAQGAGDGSVDASVQPYDIAPLQVIGEEAGGRATTLQGERSIYGGSFVCSNGLMHDELFSTLIGPARLPFPSC
jgi:histidinol-phosphatase